MFKPKSASGDDHLKKWTSQIRKGSLEMCLLSVLAHQARYGFEIVQLLNGAGGLGITEGTLYPLLNRLQNEGLIEAFWQESASGPPRKYYRLTPDGEDLLGQMRSEWRRFGVAVETLLAESERPGSPEAIATPLEMRPRPS
ncbi:MAG TPA: PadR family transcriptional regulator [Oscillatoriaceae cyanobacterium]